MNHFLYDIGQMIAAWLRLGNRVVKGARRISDPSSGTDGRRESSHAPDQIIIHLSI